MYDAKTNQAAKVNSTDLNEDLGQIEYLFSDKTGTLTENEMTFKHFALQDSTYTEYNHEIFHANNHGNLTENTPENIHGQKFKRFLEILTICHTVQIDMTSEDEKYNASSPDELSFAIFCKK